PEFRKSERRQGHFKRNLIMVFLVLLILLLLASTVLAIFVFPGKQTKTAPPATTLPVVGHVYFLSSGKLYANNNQGIYDEVLIDLHHIAAPDPGKSYYAWLLSDANKSDVTRSEEHTSELQSRGHLVCRLLLEKKKNKKTHN